MPCRRNKFINLCVIRCVSLQTLPHVGNINFCVDPEDPGGIGVDRCTKPGTKLNLMAPQASEKLTRTSSEFSMHVSLRGGDRGFDTIGGSLGEHTSTKIEF